MFQVQVLEDAVEQRDCSVVNATMSPAVNEPPPSLRTQPATR
jgi:hypothetical protein